MDPARRRSGEPPALPPPPLPAGAAAAGRPSGLGGARVLAEARDTARVGGMGSDEAGQGRERGQRVGR